MLSLVLLFNLLGDINAQQLPDYGIVRLEGAHNIPGGYSASYAAMQNEVILLHGYLDAAADTARGWFLDAYDGGINRPIFLDTNQVHYKSSTATQQILAHEDSMYSVRTIRSMVAGADTYSVILEKAFINAQGATTLQAIDSVLIAATGHSKVHAFVLPGTTHEALDILIELGLDDGSRSLQVATYERDTSGSLVLTRNVDIQYTQQDTSHHAIGGMIRGSQLEVQLAGLNHRGSGYEVVRLIYDRDAPQMPIIDTISHIGETFPTVSNYPFLGLSAYASSSELVVWPEPPCYYLQKAIHAALYFTSSDSIAGISWVPVGDDCVAMPTISQEYLAIAEIDTFHSRNVLCSTWFSPWDQPAQTREYYLAFRLFPSSASSQRDAIKTDIRLDTSATPYYSIEIRDILTQEDGYVLVAGVEDAIPHVPFGLSKEYTALIFLDSLGCLAPGCRDASSTTPSSYAYEISLSPNPLPAGGELRVRLPQGIARARYAITDTHGKRVGFGESPTMNGELVVQSPDFSSGIYYFTVWPEDSGNAVLTRGFVVE